MYIYLYKYVDQITLKFYNIDLVTIRSDNLMYSTNYGMLNDKICSVLERTEFNVGMFFGSEECQSWME